MKTLCKGGGLLMLAACTWAAGVPQSITYQGTLKQGGVPANEPHNLSFKLTDVSGLAQYGSVVHLSNVMIQKGLFAVDLDFTANGTTPIEWDKIHPYFQVSIDGQALTPTEPLNSTAYALMSASVVDGAITTVKLASGSVTTAQLAPGAVTGAQIADRSITSTLLALGAVSPANLDAAVKDLLVPPGAVMAYAAEAPPHGWLVCDGTAVDRAVFAGLFQAIGITWGAGDGANTFNLPDLRGRSPFGKNVPGTFASLGAYGGTQTHQHTQPTHAHTFTGTTSGNGAHMHLTAPNLQINADQNNGDGVTEGIRGGGRGRAAGPVHTHILSTAGFHSHTYSGITSTANPTTDSASNIPPFAVVTYIIKI